MSVPVFDRAAKLLQRQRCLLKRINGHSIIDTFYLRDMVAANTVERIKDVKRDVHRVLDIGGGSGIITNHLDEYCNVKKVLMTDACAEWLNCKGTDVKDVKCEYARLDEEDLVELKEDSFDMVLSYSSNHWVNNIETFFKNVHAKLKPDCPLIGCVPGEDNLFELRTALQLAEQEICGGVSPRVSPTLRVPDLASLLNSASFNLVTIDTEDIKVGYPDMRALMNDLRLMGESNCIIGRKPFLRRDVIARAEQIYKEMFPFKEGDGVCATYSLLYFIGWSHSAAQPKPLARGAYEKSLKDTL